MDKHILTILQTCQTLSSLSEELNKPFGWLRRKQIKEFNSITQKIKGSIALLNSQIWSIEYLYSLEYTIIPYYSYLEPYTKNFYISEDYDKTKELDPRKFYEMYFVDINHNRNTIILEIIDDVITFTIMDSNTGSTFSVSSKDRVQKSQEKIETVCKARLIETLQQYLDDCSSIHPFTIRRFFSDIKSLFKNT